MKARNPSFFVVCLQLYSKSVINECLGVDTEIIYQAMIAFCLPGRLFLDMCWTTTQHTVQFFSFYKGTDSVEQPQIEIKKYRHQDEWPINNECIILDLAVLVDSNIQLQLNIAGYVRMHSTRQARYALPKANLHILLLSYGCLIC